MTKKATRGPYARGTAKRAEILEKAIEAFGRYGYRATSMREIASAVGLSQAGLLHHFPTKEELLLAAIQERDRIQMLREDSYPDAWQDRVLQTHRENAENRELTELFTSLVVEATDNEHPAHQYFLERYRAVREFFATDFMRARGDETIGREDILKAQILTALWDGLQIQWLLDPDFDMLPAFEYAIVMLSRYSQYSN